MKRLMLVTATLFAAGCNCQPQRTAQSYQTPNNPPQYEQAQYDLAQYSQAPYSEAQYTQAPTSEVERLAAFTGPRGPEGPAGAKGAQGPAGLAGPAGVAMAGPRGPEGSVGPMGERGLQGGQGYAGDIAVGPTGQVGPAGNTGAQGPAGQAGARGASADGFAGPAGPAGVAGPQGPVGQTGPKGPTLVGPAGPAGAAGRIGERGEAGQTGAQGVTMAGIAGTAGPAGAAGPQGPTGLVGPQGPAGMVERWVTYRDFSFDPEMTVIRRADLSKVAEIATYMKASPSLQLGIDGSTYPRATASSDVNLCESRVKTVRDALVLAGVPSDRISTGEFGDMNARHDGQVEVLFRTHQPSPSGSAVVTGGADVWTSYRDFLFDSQMADIRPADRDTVSDIAAYMAVNPSLRLGIDASTNPRATTSRDVNLCNRRVASIRNALVRAGVPANRILDGMFGNVDLRRDGRVEILLNTEQLARVD